MATVSDPVCGMEVDTERTEHTAEHEGVTYFFCSRGCMLDFKEDPGQYLDPSFTPSGMDPH